MKAVKIIFNIIFIAYFSIALYGDIRLERPIGFSNITFILIVQYFIYELYLNMSKKAGD